jgi:hypothetical protein
VAKLSESLPAPRAATGWRLRERLSFWRLAAGLVPFLVALAAFLAVFDRMRPDSAGDEPHYLLVAESIAYDGDVDLANDYASRERTDRVVNVFPLDPVPHAAEYKDSGELRPVHGVGLSALLAPAVALGGLTGARLLMVLIGALLADQLYRLLRDLGFRWRYRVLAWAAAVFCMPVVVFTSQVYPEFPGALLVLVALRIMVAGARSPAQIALGSAAAAGLVWLHVRYIPISLGILVGLALSASGVPERAARGRGFMGGVRAAWVAVVRSALDTMKRWRTVAVPLIAPYAIGLGLMAITFQHWYGSPSPTAPYRAYSTTTVGSGGWDFLFEFTAADLFNPVNGWIPYVPVHWLGLAALGAVAVRFGWPGAACLGVAIGYELILSSAGPNIGWGFPARYLIILIPLIAVPLAVVIQRIGAARTVFVPLLAVSLVYAAAAVRDYQWLYPIGDKPKTFGARTTADLFPVTVPPELPTAFNLSPGGQFQPQTGKVQDGVSVARDSRDRPGYMLWGPYVSLKSGTYRATFSLASTGARDAEQVAVVEAAGTPPPRVFARRFVTAGELTARAPKNVTLEFKTPGSYLVEARVFYAGRGTLRAGPVQVQAVQASLEAPSRFPDWPLVLLWVGGTVLAGWLLVRAMRVRRDGRDDELVGEQ